jgi:hypothetical protein
MEKSDIYKFDDEDLDYNSGNKAPNITYPVNNNKNDTKPF